MDETKDDLDVTKSTSPNYPWTELKDGTKRHPRSAFSNVFTYRPNQMSADAYWHLRDWCTKNGVLFADLLNSILPAVAYYCLNYTEEEPNITNPERIKCYVMMNMGRIPIKRHQHRRATPNFTMDVADDRL